MVGLLLLLAACFGSDHNKCFCWVANFHLNHYFSDEHEKKKLLPLRLETNSVENYFPPPVLDCIETYLCFLRVKHKLNKDAWIWDIGLTTVNITIKFPLNFQPQSTLHFHRSGLYCVLHSTSMAGGVGVAGGNGEAVWWSSVWEIEAVQENACGWNFDSVMGH